MCAFAQHFDLLFVICALLPARRALEFLAVKRGRAVLRFAVSAALLAAIAVSLAQSARSFPETDTVTFGSYDGKALEWIVLDRGDEQTLLWCADSIAEMPFDSGGEGRRGSNDWENSSIREWLNTDFLSAFSEAERRALAPTRRKAYTSATDASAGLHPLYWTHVLSLVNAYNDDAYSRRLEERVFLIGIDEIAAYLTAGDIRIGKGAAFWTRTPYVPHGAMVRFVNERGQALHRDAAESLGIRPAVVIRSDAVFGPGETE
jgi:hypothetical protein